MALKLRHFILISSVVAAAAATSPAPAQAPRFSSGAEGAASQTAPLIPDFAAPFGPPRCSVSSRRSRVQGRL
jgi:hypothetical protein